MPEQPSQQPLRARPTIEIMIEATLTTALMDRDWRLARALADALDALERSRARHFADSAAADPGLMERLAADDPTARYDPATGITTFDSTGDPHTRRVLEAECKTYPTVEHGWSRCSDECQASITYNGEHIATCPAVNKP